MHMGVRVRIVLHAGSTAVAESAARAAFARFAELDAIMSDYRPDSELMRFSEQAGQGPVELSEDLWRVLRRAQQVAWLTDGAFDPTMGPLVRLWRESRRSGRLPEASQLQEARAHSGYRHLIVDPRERRAELRRKRMRLDLGGIAKGYACDEALEAAQAAGVSAALVDAGGDLAAGAPPPGATGWRVRIAGAGREILLAHGALSTSGASEQFVEIGGVRYSHILDPRTGMGLTHRRQVTVFGQDAATTDSLATAFSVLGPDAAAPLARRFRVAATWSEGSAAP
jgi:FAD:protein FMN transferase